MLLKCEFCGETFTVYNNRRRKYCPKCQYSNSRLTQQLSEKRKEDPVNHIYSKQYGKRLVSCKRGKISRGDLDDWHQKAIYKRYQVTTGEISIEEFTNWCEQTYELLLGKKEPETKPCVDGEHKDSQEKSLLAIKLICEFCGETFIANDTWRRKYCPKCKDSGKRYSRQFREKCDKNPILRIYSRHYNRRAASYRNGKISKDALEDWRSKAKIKQHEVSIGEISVEDFQNWCEQTAKSLLKNKEGQEK